MKTTSLFMNGRSQAIRLPAEFRVEGKQVDISRDPRTGNVWQFERVPGLVIENWQRGV